MARVPDPPEADDVHVVDLHGRRPDEALRRLGQELHTARLRRCGWIRVITGRGLGNAAQQPILRDRVNAWLRGPEGRRFQVLDVQVERSTAGGSLLVRLGGSGPAPGPR